MQIEIDARVLRDALKKCAFITARRTTLTILEHVKVDAHHDEIVFTATDLDRVLVIRAEGKGTGSGLLHLQGFRDAVKHLSGPVTMEVDGTKGHGTAGRGKFTVPAMPADGWPTFKHGTVTAGFKLAAQELGWAMERCYGSISKDEARVYLQGAFLHWSTFGDYSGLAVAATDGHQLTRAQMPDAVAIGKAVTPQGVAGIVPRNSVAALVRLITPAQGDDREDYPELLTVRQSGPGVLDFEADDWRLSTRLIDGSFPDYLKILDGLAPSRRVTVGTDELRAAAGRLAAMKAGPVTIQLCHAGKVNFIVNGEGIEAAETLAAETVGSPVYVGVQLRHLIAAADMADGPELSLALSDPSSPVLLDMPDHDGHLLHVIMCCKVDQPEADDDDRAMPAKPVKAKPVKHREPVKPRKPVPAPADIKGDFTPVK